MSLHLCCQGVFVTFYKYILNRPDLRKTPTNLSNSQIRRTLFAISQFPMYML